MKIRASLSDGSHHADFEIKSRSTNQRTAGGHWNAWGCAGELIQGSCKPNSRTALIKIPKKLASEMRRPRHG